VLREPSSDEDGGEEEEEEEESDEGDSEGGAGAGGAGGGADAWGLAAGGEPEPPSEEDDEDGGDGAAPSQYELLARRKREAAAGPRRVLSAQTTALGRCTDSMPRSLLRSGVARKRARLAGGIGHGTAAELDALLAAGGRRRNSRAAARRRKTRAKTGAAMVRPRRSKLTAVACACAECVRACSLRTWNASWARRRFTTAAAATAQLPSC